MWSEVCEKYYDNNHHQQVSGKYKPKHAKPFYETCFIARLGKFVLDLIDKVDKKIGG